MLAESVTLYSFAPPPPPQPKILDRTLPFLCLADRDDDLLDVVDSVQPLAGSWPKLALNLRLKSQDIEVIQKNHPNDAQGALQDSIVQWLRKNYNFERFGDPSWRILVGAVRRMDNALANKIADEHRGT
jgi:hypothetical protein